MSNSDTGSTSQGGYEDFSAYGDASGYGDARRDRLGYGDRFGYGDRAGYGDHLGYGDQPSQTTISFSDLGRLIAVVEKALSTPQRINIERIFSLIRTTHQVLACRPIDELGLGELINALRKEDISDTPMEFVFRSLEVVQNIPIHVDTLANVSLRDLQRILDL